MEVDGVMVPTGLLTLSYNRVGGREGLYRVVECVRIC